VGFATCESSFRFELDFLGGLECSESRSGIVVLELVKFLEGHAVFKLLFFCQFLLFGNVVSNCVLPNVLVILLFLFYLFFGFFILEGFYCRGDIATVGNNLRECEHVVIAGGANAIGSDDAVISGGRGKPNERVSVDPPSIDCSHQEEAKNRLRRD